MLGSISLIQILTASSSISSKQCSHLNSENDIHILKLLSLMIGTLVLNGLVKPKRRKIDFEKRWIT